MDTENKYGTLEMQKRLLQLLKDFHAFCIENSICYSLDWGSLLGAVRHKGFIPWDDDLDIMVDRENYEKIRECIGGKLIYVHGSPDALWVDRIRLQTDSDVHVPTIDVFIIDNAPDKAFSRKLRVVLIHALQGMLKSNPNYKKGNILYRLASFATFLAGHCFSRSTMMTWYNALSQLSNNKDTQMKASYNTDFGDVPKLYHNDVVKEYVIVPFENIKVYITKGYHQALIDKFGPDYMTPLPKNERIPKHL